MRPYPPQSPANSAFSLKYPGEDGEISLCVRMGENAANMRGTILIPGMSHPVRHLVVVSQTLRQNGIDGCTYLLNYSPQVAWALMASVMGLPARPEWGSWIIDQLDLQHRISPLTGFGCNPYSIRATRDELLDILGKGVRSTNLCFPEANGPVHWPNFTVAEYFQAPNPRPENRDLKAVESNAAWRLTISTASVEGPGSRKKPCHMPTCKD